MSTNTSEISKIQLALEVDIKSLSQSTILYIFVPTKKNNNEKVPTQNNWGGYLHTKNSPYVYLRVSFFVALAWVWNIFIVPSAHHGSGDIISLT